MDPSATSSSSSSSSSNASKNLNHRNPRSRITEHDLLQRRQQDCDALGNVIRWLRSTEAFFQNHTENIRQHLLSKGDDSENDEVTTIILRSLIEMQLIMISFHLTFFSHRPFHLLWTHPKTKGSPFWVKRVHRSNVDAGF